MLTCGADEDRTHGLQSAILARTAESSGETKFCVPERPVSGPVTDGGTKQKDAAPSFLRAARGGAPALLGDVFAAWAIEAAPKAGGAR